MEEDLVFAVAIGLDRTDPGEVHNDGSVNSAKHIRIEVLFQFRHTATHQMSFGLDVQAGVVIRGLDPVDVGGLKE